MLINLPSKRHNLINTRVSKKLQAKLRYIRELSLRLVFLLKPSRNGRLIQAFFSVSVGKILQRVIEMAEKGREAKGTAKACHC